MAEIKLICPGCEAEYALPPDAIPPEGREVECSDCGHVWQARPPGRLDRLDLAGFAQTANPPALPPASQRLPPDMLDLLREEVEHERRLRAVDPAPATEQPEADQPTAPTVEPDMDWPATTVTGPEPATEMVPLMAPARPAPGMAPTDMAASRSLHPDRLRTQPPVQTRLSAPAAVIRHTAPGDVPEPAAPPMTAAAPRRLYGLGLGLMLALAAGVVAFYVWAPVDDGTALSEVHDWLQAARLWLDQQVQRLLG